MIRRTVVVPAALFLLFVAGCANSQDDAGSTSSGSVPAVAASASAQASSSGLPEATKSGKPVADTTTLTGKVAAGIEPNCLLLQETTSGTHLLVFKDETLRAAAVVGSTVRVTGTPQPGMMTTCQQGEPFLVSAVTPG